MIQVAILGAAHPHVSYALDELAAREDCVLAGVAEPDPAMRAAYLPGLGGAPLYDSPADLLADRAVDVALVAGVYRERGSAVLAALEAGAHVIADKPLCTSLDELDLIEQRAAQTDRHVCIVFEKRFHPVTRAVRRLLGEGELGELALIASTGPHKLNLPSRPPWFLQRQTYGGIAGDLPVHDIDLALLLAGATSGTVCAQTGNARRAEHPNFDDHVAVLLRAGATTATIEANWLAPQASEVHGHYRMRLTGSEGTAELDWAYGSLTVETHGRARRAIDLPDPVRPAAFFFDAVATGSEPEITTAQSLLATRVALLAQESADHGGEQRHW
ncbi:Gfo/Idh/MocA family protein [Ruania halotolerans]|uniref:Gfo/Idh/MocA family protein n=1 Tax=Ruania halotolerans TaxID=2897773 RepID=UPI001E3120C3|nr:Gfo/Idh/MocA family oxidoreductase [Ruania halotolerans]UFU06901.1 Gfo/Idh/MocA family oxidoreductase [Ruania halotolerans]